MKPMSAPMIFPKMRERREFFEDEEEGSRRLGSEPGIPTVPKMEGKYPSLAAA